MRGGGRFILERELENLNKIKRPSRAGLERKLLDQAQELLGYHRKSAIQAIRAPTVERGPRILTGRPTLHYGTTSSR
jgi:hypothetical protein